jgi:hypothetical protein
MTDPSTHLRSLQYRAPDAPWYRLGHGLVLLYICIGNVSSIAYYIFLRRENATRDRGERDEVIEGVFREKEGAEEREERARRNGRFASVEEAKREKGDLWSGYRYILWNQNTAGLPVKLWRINVPLRYLIHRAMARVRDERDWAPAPRSAEARGEEVVRKWLGIVKRGDGAEWADLMMNKEGQQGFPFFGTLFLYQYLDSSTSLNTKIL